MKLMSSFIEPEDVGNQNFEQSGLEHKKLDEEIPVIKEYEKIKLKKENS